MPQDDLAELSGKMKHTISNIEKGRADPRISSYFSAAKGLGINLGFIISEAEYTPVIYSPTLENLIKRLQHEDEKTIKIIADIADNILSAKKK